MSVAPSGSTYNFDTVSNGGPNDGSSCTGGGNAPCPVAIPTLQSTIVSRTATTATLNFSWTALSNLLGYYDSAPSSNMITGYEIRSYTGATPPPDYSLSTFNTTVATVSIGASGTDPGVLNGIVVNLPSSGATYYGLSVLFDGASAGDAYRETKFVGPGFNIGPTPAGVFASFNAGRKAGHHHKIVATWRTNVETGAAFFQVYYAASVNGTYTPIDSTITQPKGNNSVYSVTFRKPKGIKARDLYLKVMCTDMDNTTYWSTPATLSPAIVVPVVPTVPPKPGLKRN